MAATDERESLVSRFARSVATHRDALAVVAGEERLTYGELAARARALAGALARAGAGRDVPVGLLLDRSADMVSGMLGILEAGAAYLPLDPALPAPRLAAMLADAGARCLVTDARHAPLAAGLGATVIRVDVQDRTAAPGERADVQGRDLAYLLYTSGSTGVPNGVMVEHRNVLALLDAFERLAPRGAALSGAALCPFGFDVSVWKSSPASRPAARCISSRAGPPPTRRASCATSASTASPAPTCRRGSSTPWATHSRAAARRSIACWWAWSRSARARCNACAMRFRGCGS